MATWRRILLAVKVGIRVCLTQMSWTGVDCFPSAGLRACVRVRVRVCVCGGVSFSSKFGKCW